MRGSFRGIRIDRERALKAGAMVGLAVLGISVLPGLLKTPKPPPIPADVGFRPAEMARYADAPTPEKPERQKSETRKKRPAKQRQRRRDRASAPRRRDEDRKPAKRKERPERTGAQPSTPSASAVPSAPVPAPAPVLAAPPAPEPTPPPVPDDGSQEFAPR